jgi:hypothetical protein
MSLLQAFQSLLEAAMLYIAVTVSHFEADTLYIPPALPFFTVEAGPDELFKQAFMFALAPVHAFITIPLLAKVHGRHASQPRSYGLLGCGSWYLQLLATFWVIILLVRAMHFEEDSAITWQNRYSSRYYLSAG